MFKVLSRYPSFIRQTSLFFSPTEAKITKVIEKLKDPNIKVVVVEIPKSRFSVLKSCVFLGCALAFFKKQTPKEESPAFFNIPSYHPLHSLISPLKKQLNEDPYSIESMKNLGEKVAKAAKNAFFSAVHSISKFLYSAEVDKQKKLIEELTYENGHYKKENQDLQSSIASKIIDHSDGLKKIAEELSLLSAGVKKQETLEKTLSLMQEERDMTMKNIKEKLVFLSNSQNRLHSQALEINERLTILPILLKQQDSLKDDLVLKYEKIDEKLHNLKEITNSLHASQSNLQSNVSSLAEKVDLNKAEESLLFLQQQLDILIEEIGDVKTSSLHLTHKTNQIALDLQKVEKEVSTSFLEKFKNLSVLKQDALD